MNHTDTDIPYSIPEGYGLENLFHCKNPVCEWVGTGYELEDNGSCPKCGGKKLGVGLKKSASIEKLLFSEDFKKLSARQIKEYKEKLEQSGALDPPGVEHSEETDDVNRSYYDACEYMPNEVDIMQV